MRCDMLIGRDRPSVYALTPLCFFFFGLLSGMLLFSLYYRLFSLARNTGSHSEMAALRVGLVTSY